MRQANVLGKVIIRTQPETGNHIRVRIPGCQEHDWQYTRHGSQLPTQLETTLNIITQANINDNQIRQSEPKGIHCTFSVTIPAHLVALAPKGILKIAADGNLVFDNRNTSWHISSRQVFVLMQLSLRLHVPRVHPLRSLCHIFASIRPVSFIFRPR